jgi:hypothetical protein
MAWVYRHRTLAPIALTSHVMLFFNTMVSTVFVVYALRELRVGDLGLGVTYACAGMGAVLGGALSGRVLRRCDVGVTLIVFRVAAAVGWLPIVLAQAGSWALPAVSAAFFLVSLAIAVESPVELSYPAGGDACGAAWADERHDAVVQLGHGGRGGTARGSAGRSGRLSARVVGGAVRGGPSGGVPGLLPGTGSTRHGRTGGPGGRVSPCPDAYGGPCPDAYAGTG